MNPWGRISRFTEAIYRRTQDFFTEIYRRIFFYDKIYLLNYNNWDDMNQYERYAVDQLRRLHQRHDSVNDTFRLREEKTHEKMQELVQVIKRFYYEESTQFLQIPALCYRLCLFLFSAFLLFYFNYKTQVALSERERVEELLRNFRLVHRRPFHHRQRLRPDIPMGG
ncbi:hypothetical protein CDAR_196921 [Caerostris darwini]|uniref:Uncharacterized protein n=1 Tax=Caerostris darwini TaxID=1538125 RepID=A0AAV4PWK4_9ARAC|nr:hypothetical protein CDAR_196921 [Caerostris darwini]